MVTGNRHPRHGLRPRRVKGVTRGLALVGLIATLAQGAVGCAVAGVDPHTHAGSTVIVQQGYGTETRITRYRDGHAVVTRDRVGTDITIQRSSPHATRRGGRPRHEDDNDRFDSPWVKEDVGSGADHGQRSPLSHDDGTSGTREAFRQRMFDRLEAYPPPR
jgi:hypothetical protein